MKIKLLYVDGQSMLCSKYIWLKKWKWIREKFDFKAENNKWIRVRPEPKGLMKKHPISMVVVSHGHPYTYH